MFGTLFPFLLDTHGFYKSINGSQNRQRTSHSVRTLFHCLRHDQSGNLYASSWTNTRSWGCLEGAKPAAAVSPLKSWVYNCTLYNAHCQIWVPQYELCGSSSHPLLSWWSDTTFETGTHTVQYESEHSFHHNGHIASSPNQRIERTSFNQCHNDSILCHLIIKLTDIWMLLSNHALYVDILWAHICV